MATALSPEALMRPPEVALKGLLEKVRSAEASKAPALSNDKTSIKTKQAKSRL